MKNKASTLLAFVFGAAAGSLVTWHYVKNYYEQIAQDEIDSVKEVFQKRNKENREKRFKEPDNTKQLAECNKKIQECGYHDAENDIEEMPHVIAPYEFGEFDDYEKISLTYYSDSVLADENDEIIENVDETVGICSLTHFGEYEADFVFVRNDARKCDYEILLDQRPYSEAVH